MGASFIACLSSIIAGLRGDRKKRVALIGSESGLLRDCNDCGNGRRLALEYFVQFLLKAIPAISHHHFLNE